MYGLITVHFQYCLSPACRLAHVPCMIAWLLLFKVVAAEKIHQNLLDGVEQFDKGTMKHTETTEKNPLPPVEGLSGWIYIN